MTAFLIAPIKLVCLALVLAIAFAMNGIATHCQTKSELREAASQPPTPPQSRVIAAVPVLSGAGTAAGDPQ